MAPVLVIFNNCDFALRTVRQLSRPIRSNVTECLPRPGRSFADAASWRSASPTRFRLPPLAWISLCEKSRLAPRRIGVLGRREAALPHLLGIFAGGRADLVAEAAIAFDEFRGELGEEAEHVVDYQDLPVTGRRGADPDRRYCHCGGQLAREALGNPFDHQR